MAEKITLDAVLDFCRRVPTHDIAWELETLRGIRAWALAQQPVQAGDRVRIREGFAVGPALRKNGGNNGWYGYRHCLIPGALATVQDVHFNAHYGTWHADILLDSEWGQSDSGHRWEHANDERGLFAMHVKWLERIDAPPTRGPAAE